MTGLNSNQVASRRRGGVSSASYATEAVTDRRQVELSISVRTILLVLAAVALAWAVTSLADVLLVILGSMFSVAVLLPVVDAMERSGWRRGPAVAVLVLGLILVIGLVLLVLAQAINGAVNGFGDHLPEIVGKARASDLGSVINGGGDPLDPVRDHAGDIVDGVGTVSGGVADVGVSAFGAVALVFSVLFLRSSWPKARRITQTA